MAIPIRKIQEALSNDSSLESFAAYNQLSKDAAKALLERLLREPESSPEAEKYVFSGNSSADLKGYVAGEDKGYKRGHDAGFAKGSAVGLIVAGSVFLLVKARKLLG